jgi:AraC family transcriptional activator of pobA
MKDRFPVYDISNLSGFKQDDILISRFAPYLAIHKNLELPHRHTFYHLVLFTEGGGNHVIDFQRFPVEPYQIYFMVPGQVHGWSFEGVVDGYVINFSVAFFNSFLHRSDYLEQFPFFSGVSADEVILIPAPSREKIRDLFEQALEESENGKPMAADQVRLLILQLFIAIGRLSLAKKPTDKQTYNYTLLRSFQKLVDKNYATLRLPKEYAELLFITPNHLSALCNQVLGIAAGTVIRNRIALEAKRLLVNFELTITEISGRLNFQDNSYFARFFKKQEGITPEEFRKEIKKQAI